MEDDEAERIDDSVAKELTVPVDVEPIQAGKLIESIPEETEEAMKPRMMSIPPAPSRQEVREHRITHMPIPSTVPRMCSWQEPLDSTQIVWRYELKRDMPL